MDSGQSNEQRQMQERLDQQTEQSKAEEHRTLESLTNQRLQIVKSAREQRWYPTDT